MRWYWLIGLTALVWAHGVASAQQARMDIGLLTCGLVQGDETPSETDAAPLRQTREVLCAFRPINSGAEETYTGALRSVGLEKELSEKRVMIWVVKGIPGTAGSPAGLLQQVYAADAAANAGHAPPLIGETNMSIVLQAMADAQAPPGADTKRVAIAMIVLVTLKLKSTPT